MELENIKQRHLGFERQISYILFQMQIWPPNC